MASSSPSHDEEKNPLLQDSTIPEVERNSIQQAISQTFQSTAQLANRLPTGTYLAFRLLAPILSNQGECTTKVNVILTLILLGVCAFLCFLLTFTDSFKDQSGKISYGFATFKGLKVIDGSVEIPAAVASKYKLQFVDFLHAFMSLGVFATVALFDRNVVNCIMPEPSDEIKTLLMLLPIGLGVVSSILFLEFPTNRHGIGFPLPSPPSSS